jgi:hypothetical protein
LEKIDGHTPKKYENQDRGADKPITVQEQHTAWKSRATEYGPAFRIRQAFFSECYGRLEKMAKFNIPATGRQAAGPRRNTGQCTRLTEAPRRANFWLRRNPGFAGISLRRKLAC